MWIVYVTEFVLAVVIAITWAYLIKNSTKENNPNHNDKTEQP